MLSLITEVEKSDDNEELNLLQGEDPCTTERESNHQSGVIR